MTQTMSGPAGVNVVVGGAREVTKKVSLKDESKDAPFQEVLFKILPAAAGSAIEFYEYGIYTYLGKYMTNNFFANGHGGSIGMWAGFAVPFVLRPLGGAFFGWIADRHGRKLAMQLTISIMLFSTVLQGCLPTFYSSGETWGWFGLVVLLIIRALQGLSAGGELTTAAVYISEVSPRATLGLNLSWMSLAGVFGSWAAAACVVVLVELLLGEEAMMMWGWRIPYLTTLIPGFFVVVGRRYLKESDDFERMMLEEELRKSELETGSNPSVNTQGPFAELLSEHKMALFVGTLGIGGFGALSFIPPIYGVQFIQQSRDIDNLSVTISQIISYILPAVLSVPVGLLTDEWGVGRVYGLSMLLGCVIAPIPLLNWWAHVPGDQVVQTLYLGQMVLGLLMALSTSAFLWVVELFPIRVRTTGASLAYSIGLGLFGGLGPLLSDIGNTMISPQSLVSAPAAITVFSGITSAMAIYGSRWAAQRGLMRVTHLRDSPY